MIEVEAPATDRPYRIPQWRQVTHAASLDLVTRFDNLPSLTRSSSKSGSDRDDGDGDAALRDEGTHIVRIADKELIAWQR